MRTVLILLLITLAVAPAWATPSAAEQALARPYLPNGYQLDAVVRLASGERALVMTGPEASRVCVLPAKASAPAMWVITKGGKRDLPAIVQGMSGEKMSQLVYTGIVGRERLLFVTTYLADVYTFTVCRPTAGGYRQIFQVGSMETPKFDPKTQRITVVNLDDRSDISRKEIYKWQNDTFVRTSSR